MRRAERFALKEHLGAHGIPVEDMVEAGLLMAGDDIPVPYDRFRDRVMFPITDLRGRVIAFGGRALEKDVPAKYLNSPETPLFHKGDNLYNLAPARHRHPQRRAAGGGRRLCRRHRHGRRGLCRRASRRSAPRLTENQLALLWKMADEPILCFDGDKAGQKAAWRAADLALPHLKPGKSLRFALLPEGQDPDDLARSGGRGAIEEVIAAARGLADVIWSREIEGGTFATPGAARGAGGAHRRACQRHPRRGGAALLSPGSQPSGCSGPLRRKPRAAAMAGGNFAAAWRWRIPAAALAARGSFTPGAAGRFEARGRPQPSSASQTINRGPYQAASPQLGAKPDHARPAQRAVPPRGADPADPD